MMGSTSGKVIEVNKRGFRIKNEYGVEIQVDAGQSKRFIKVGDEVQVKGGLGEDKVFFEAWTTVLRSGRWLAVEELVKQRRFRLTITIFCAIALVLLTAGVLIWVF